MDCPALSEANCMFVPLECNHVLYGILTTVSDGEHLCLILLEPWKFEILTRHIEGTRGVSMTWLLDVWGHRVGTPTSGNPVSGAIYQNSSPNGASYLCRRTFLKFHRLQGGTISYMNRQLDFFLACNLQSWIDR